MSPPIGGQIVEDGVLIKPPPVQPPAPAPAPVTAPVPSPSPEVIAAADLAGRAAAAAANALLAGGDAATIAAAAQAAGATPEVVQALAGVPAPTVAPPPPAPVVAGVTAATIAAADLAGRAAAAAANALLAGGDAPTIAAAAQAAGATPDVVQALLGIFSTPPPALADEVGDRSASLPIEDGPDLGDRELAANNPVLSGAAFVDYVRTRCEHYNLDPLAVFANFLEEGASGKVGDSGAAYGPWQIHATDGRLRSFAHLGLYNDQVNTWCWSRDGIDYALRSMVAGGAAGLRGHAAVHAIVYGFEKPLRLAADDAARQDLYDHLVGLGGGVWAGLADAAAGPVHTAPGLQAPSGSGPAGGAAASTEPAAGDVHTAWSDLMIVYGRTLPAAETHIRDARRALARAVT